VKRFPKLLLLAVLGMAATISSCENNDANAPVVTAPSSPTYSTGRVILSGEITTSRTLRANEKYLLQGNVCMTSGNTLTVPAGTKIFGDLTTEGTLVIERGAKILAEGKQTNPIVFTSAQAAGSRKYGDWGRVVLVGAASINRPLGTLPEGGIRSLFGGTNAADNSGTMEVRADRVCRCGAELRREQRNQRLDLVRGGLGHDARLHSGVVRRR